ncbi:hypothetical protein N657DRAFT_420288 [Parathielavia appendiculata]|uniref:Uncharacterized protein n=1 Tax=Parathielavia appendiculata TaxID=2587402 RepID=A0AAN6Z2X9_9PEZI|nr:hypothetical protein N657DRAFT_420288 [Parathielavia appendiculata]
MSSRSEVGVTASTESIPISSIPGPRARCRNQHSATFLTRTDPRRAHSKELMRAQSRRRQSMLSLDHPNPGPTPSARSRRKRRATSAPTNFRQHPTPENRPTPNALANGRKGGVSDDKRPEPVSSTQQPSESMARSIPEMSERENDIDPKDMDGSLAGMADKKGKTYAFVPPLPPFSHPVSPKCRCPFLRAISQPPETVYREPHHKLQCILIPAN